MPSGIGAIGVSRDELGYRVLKVLEMLERAWRDEKDRPHGTWVSNKALATVGGIRYGARLNDLKDLGFTWAKSTKIPGATHHYMLTSYPPDWEGAAVMKTLQMQLPLGAGS